MILPQLSSTPGGILFIGEAPSDEECIKGRVLVGPTGNLLARSLRAADLLSVDDPPTNYEPHLPGETRRMLWTRRLHSFTNVFDEQLPDNEVKTWCWPAKDEKEWQATKPTVTLTGLHGAGWLRPEYYHHLARLRAEILKVRPNIIVPLGGTALWSVFGLNMIDAYRGAVRLMHPSAPVMVVSTGRLGETIDPEENAYLGSIKILPTYHPAFLFKQYKRFSTLIGDLIKVKREADFPEIRPEQIELWLEPTLGDLRAFSELHVARSELLSIDIETSGNQIVCVGISTDRSTGLVVPFVDYRQPSRSYWPSETDELAAWQWLAGVLDNDIPKLMQNGGGFDVYRFLVDAGLPVRNYRHDLRLVHHVLFPELPKSLAYMGKTYTDLPAWKANVQHGDQGKRDE